MAKPVVAVLRTKPETVLEDYARLLDLAGYQDHLDRSAEVALKINISWHHWYPACSTAPWQLEGVIKKLLADGWPRERIYGAHNRTVVVSAKKGEIANKHKPVLDKYGIRNIHLYEPEEEWVRYEPKGKMLALPEIYPDGILIPKRLIGSNIIQLPTAKTHVFTTMTGAMKNAFGGLLHERRHWTHSVIHETLVDLLTIQKEIHPGLFAVTDATLTGDGPGPRCMVPHEKDLILASADQVAIDAITAKMMGFDPMSLKFIRLAHEAGLGVGDSGWATPPRSRWWETTSPGRTGISPATRTPSPAGARNSSTGGRSSPWRNSCCAPPSPPGPTSPPSSTTTCTGIRVSESAG